MSTFEFRKDDTVIARVEAKNERAAHAYVREQIVVRKLSAREIIETAQEGRAIIDAETGKAIGAEAVEPQP